MSRRWQRRDALLRPSAVAAARRRRSRSRPAPGRSSCSRPSKGTIEFETYPEEAPKTVARIVELVKKNFYNGLRFHRVEPNFVVQVGDPASRDVSRRRSGAGGGSGKPIGVAEITKKRQHVLGAVAMALSGQRSEDRRQPVLHPEAQRPELDGKYTVFGKVLKGMDVVGKIQKGRRAQTSVSEGRGGKILTRPFRSG